MVAAETAARYRMQKLHKKGKRIGESDLIFCFC